MIQDHDSTIMEELQIIINQITNLDKGYQELLSQMELAKNDYLTRRQILLRKILDLKTQQESPVAKISRE